MRWLPLEKPGKEDRDLPSFSFNSILEICLLTLKESNTHAPDWVSLPEPGSGELLPSPGNFTFPLFSRAPLQLPMAKWKEISIPPRLASIFLFFGNQGWACQAGRAWLRVRLALENGARSSHEIATSFSMPVIPPS